MSKKKKDNQGTEDITKNDIVNSINTDNTIKSDTNLKDEGSNFKEDNPFSKKVTAEIDKVNHNKNNEILSDSDLIGNIIL